MEGKEYEGWQLQKEYPSFLKEFSQEWVKHVLLMNEKVGVKKCGGLKEQSWKKRCERKKMHDFVLPF